MAFCMHFGVAKVACFCSYYTPYIYLCVCICNVIKACLFLIHLSGPLGKAVQNPEHMPNSTRKMLSRSDISRIELIKAPPTHSLEPWKRNCNESFRRTPPYAILKTINDYFVARYRWIELIAGLNRNCLHKLKMLYISNFAFILVAVN